MGLRIEILGPVEVWAGGERIPLSGRRQTALLAYLTLNADRSVSSDELLEAVWLSERSPGAAKRLSVAISRLRSALEPGSGQGASPLRTVNGGYMLALSPDQLDAMEFEAGLREGRRALDAGDAVTARDRLRAALSLWRGPALAQVGLEEFAQGEIRRLEELRLQALESRIDADLELGVDGELIGELAALVARHPEREQLAGKLMVALYSCGRQAEALEVYQRTRAHLITELGLEPGPGLRELQAQILEQAPVLAARTRAAGRGLNERLIPGELVTMLVVEARGAAAAASPRLSPDREAVAGLTELMRRAWAGRPGVEVLERVGGLLAVFASPRAALAAAIEARDLPADVQSPETGELRVRIGVHTGQLWVSAGSYWGEDVQYAARLAEAAADGQILVSAVSAALSPDESLVDLGEHRLAGFPLPQHVFGLGPGPHAPPRTVNPLRCNLPAPHGELIGREREHAAVLGTLRDGPGRLVTITGLGGSGKTRLALAVAETMLDELADGAFIIELAQVSDGAAVAAAIAAPLGIQLPAGGDQAESIATALAGRELLLVLDNFEHVLTAAPMIATLVAKAPALRVIVTSQAPLRIRPEHVFALGPLELPEADDVASLVAAPASRLLLERIREADAAFALTPENGWSVARLARALDGVPLAIELAAARLTLLSPAELLARLDGGIDAIGRGPRDLPARQRGLRAALDWTHGLLGIEDATLLRRLSVFAGPVSLERIEQVCGAGIDPLEALAQLVDLSLVSRTADGRFILHAAVRNYARERLTAAGEEEVIARHHAEALAEAAAFWGNRVLLDVGTVQSAVLREEADIMQALSWSAGRDPERFARLAGGAAASLLFMARLTPWNELIENALGGEKLTGEPRVWLLLAGSLAAFQRQNVELARARLASTVAAADGLGDERLACLMRASSIIFHVLTGATEGLREEHNRLAARVQELEDGELTALVEGIEPYILGYCERRYAEAAAIWTVQSADRTRTDFAGWTALYCLPDCQLLQGDHRNALLGFQAALASARERGQTSTVAYQLEGIAMALADLGRHEEALQAAGWAQTVRQAAGPAVNTWYKAMFDRAVQTATSGLGAARAGSAFAGGRRLSLDQAVNAALGCDFASELAARTPAEAREPGPGA